MKYVTKEIFKTITYDSTASRYTQAFSAIEQSHQFITKKLGEGWKYSEVSRTKTENISCPNGCNNKFVYVDTIYTTNDIKKRVLSVKCPHCNSVFYAYQETSRIYL